jgi:CRP-like cAMP-binding protein
MEELQSFKEFLCCFHPCHSEALDFLLSECRTANFKKGTTIIKPGQIQREMFLVKSGIQMSYFESEEDRHVIAFTYHPNFCAIPESFTRQQGSPYFLQCLTDSVMYTLDYTHWDSAMDRYPALERLFRKIAETMLAGIIERHIQRLTLSMEERYIQFCNRSGHLLNTVPHKYLASYLDIDPTNFSKLFNQVKI